MAHVVCCHDMHLCFAIMQAWWSRDERPWFSAHMHWHVVLKLRRYACTKWGSWQLASSTNKRLQAEYWWLHMWLHEVNGGPSPCFVGVCDLLALHPCNACLVNVDVHTQCMCDALHCAFLAVFCIAVCAHILCSCMWTILGYWVLHVQCGAWFTACISLHLDVRFRTLVECIDHYWRLRASFAVYNFHVATSCVSALHCLFRQ